MLLHDVSVCKIKEIAVLFPVNLHDVQNKFVHKTIDTKGTELFRLMLKFAPNNDKAMLYHNFDNTINKGNNVIIGKSKINMCSFCSYISEVCFFDNRCMIYGLNKLVSFWRRTNSSFFWSFPWCSFVLGFFVCLKKTLNI